MKKFMALLLVLFSALGLMACSASNPDNIELQTETISNLTAEDSASLQETTTTESQKDMILMVMVKGKLYFDTGRESTADSRCGMMDGEITSAVERWEEPTEDDQSNFGIGYGYQIGVEEGTIEVYMNGKWLVFEK